MRDLLRALMIKEQISESLGFFEQIIHSLFCSQKTSNLLQKKKKKLDFYVYFKMFFFLVFKNELIAHSLLLKSNVSESLRLLTKNEQP